MRLIEFHTHLLSFFRSIKFFLLLTLTLAFATALHAQATRTLPLNLDSVATTLAAAPMEFSNEAQANPLLFSLPLPEGGDLLFKVVESPIMAADFAAAFPNIRTYSVQAVGNPAVQGRLTVTPNGLFGVIFTSIGIANIHPVDLLNPVLHEVTYAIDLAEAVCNFDEIGNLLKAEEGTPKNSISNGATRRTYEMAIVTTGEFYNGNGATVPAATAVVTSSVNSIQAIYDRELAVRFTLLTPFIYTDPATDNIDPNGNRTLEAAEAVAANFAIGTYDVGHIFHTYTSGGSGVAALGVICDNSSYAPISGTGPLKAAGWSGNSSNTSNGWIQLASHEFGHMFNMRHTFNGTGGSCTSNISSTTAYEIGSGTSIMSYSGSCQANNNVPESGAADNYFHANSLEAAHTFISGETCHTAASTGNTPPVVNANPCGGSHTIPKSTPFTLTGSATDANNDVVYYSWEQYDEDGAGTPTQGYIGSTAAGSSIAPLFRSYPPTTSPSRTFPIISLVAANTYATSFEPLPTVARTLNFRLFARDWNTNGGGINCQSLAVTVSAQGPLAVTAPNGGESIAAGSSTTVTWNLNGITFLTNVNIKLSIDGGLTYPYTLISNTSAADGTESVSIPAGVPNTTTARMRVESATNTCVVFFDISNANFTITSDCNAAPSNICPTTPVTAAFGDPALNLSLSKYYGSTVTGQTFSIVSTDPNLNIPSTNSAGNGCVWQGWVNKFKSQGIAVSTTGSYTFSISGSASFSGIIIYDATFSPPTACTGWIACNYRQNGGSTTIYSTVTATLTACTPYIIVGTNLNASTPFTVTYTVSGPGTVYQNNAAPSADYAYTYAAVNNANSQVAAVSATSNFTSLTAGSYTVYGASYKSSGATPPANVNPANWVGQTISAILSGGDCAVFSTNSKQVTVTGGCTPPTITAPTLTQPTCAVPTGTILVNASGSGTLEYSIDNGSTYQLLATFASLAAGSYNIKVRFVSDPSCVATYAGNPVTINLVPSAPTINSVTVTQPTCATPTGTIAISASGSGTLEYSVDNGSSYQTSSTFPGLAAGSYNVKVRLQSDPTCETTYGNNPVAINAAPSAPTINSVTLTQPTCAVSTGTISISANGSGTLEYSVDNGSNYQTSSMFPSLAAGSYNVKVRLQSDPTCEATYGSNPVAINPAPSAPTFNSVTVTQPTCATPTGTIAISASGSGTLEYSVDNGSIYQTSSTFSGLAAGSYNVKVRLQSDPTCVTTYGSNPVTINPAPSAPTFNSVIVTQPTCATPTGTIAIGASGSGTLEYSVDNGSSYQTSSTFPGLAAGSYTVKVRLQSDPTCVTTYGSNPVTINAASSAPTVNAPTVTQPTCAVPTGTIVVDASGSGTLEYSVNDGSSYQLSATFSGLAAGSYDIRVRLQSDPTCNTAYASNPVIINAAPSAPTVSAPTVTQPTCAVPTGTIVVDASGSGTLEYSVNDGSSYQLSATFSGLAAGSYDIRVRLQSDPTCNTAYASNPVIINAAPSAPTVSAPTVTQPSSCSNLTGTIEVNASGSGALEFSVDNGASWQSSSTFSSLPLGSYNIVVHLQADPACQTSYAGNPVEIIAPASCCLLPTYTNPCTSDDYIEDFTFGSFTNLGTGCANPGASNYSNYLGTGPDVQLSETYSVTLRAGTKAQYFGVYIDFNGNGIYTDAGEFFDIGQASSNSTVTANVAIPATATIGAFTMRVRSSFDAPLTSADGCQTNLAFGETEDYDIDIFCPNNLAVDGVPILDGTYNADQEITSMGMVPGSGNVTFSVETSVLLQPNFEVQLGGAFTVILMGCFP